MSGKRSQSKLGKKPSLWNYGKRPRRILKWETYLFLYFVFMCGRFRLLALLFITSLEIKLSLILKLIIQLIFRPWYIDRYTSHNPARHVSVVLFTHTQREGGELKEAGVTGENERLSDQKDRYVGAEIRTIQFSLSFGKVIYLLCLQPPIMTKNGKKYCWR